MERTLLSVAVAFVVEVELIVAREVDVAVVIAVTAGMVSDSSEYNQERMPVPKWLTVLNAEVIACTRCPRLVEYRERIAREKRRAYLDHDYWGKPVPGFGDWNARVLVLGLAPGAHGSNRTGRPFTGDASGKFMYPVLYETGFASLPTATARDDGQVLTDLYITAAARCAPPDNKPLPEELANCAPFLERELEGLKNLRVIVALGRIGFEAYLNYLAAQKTQSPTKEDTISVTAPNTPCPTDAFCWPRTIPQIRTRRPVS